MKVDKDKTFDTEKSGTDKIRGKGTGREATEVTEFLKLLEESVGENLYQIILSHPRNREKVEKVKVRPVLLKGRLLFQRTAYIGNQVFHSNMDKETLIEEILRYLERDFRQCEIEADHRKATVLVSKKGKWRVSSKRLTDAGKTDLSHNRSKNHILEEGRPVPFLIDLGVQTNEGEIRKSRYDKFKQINRFLEFIEDILPTLPKDRTVRIIDFGCGKSYLTFAVYYYLRELKGLDVRITGLDLKKDVIEGCQALALKYGYENLEFVHGDIGSYKESGNVDMVITLHACDTATDYALEKAVAWNTGVILSVPCCQHEVNGQIRCEALAPALRYGLIKERMSALLTDAVRAGLLEGQGYDVQLMEFIDMEHTPKNIMIRAVKRLKASESDGERIKKKEEIEKLTDFLHIKPTLQKLL